MVSSRHTSTTPQMATSACAFSAAWSDSRSSLAHCSLRGASACSLFARSAPVRLPARWRMRTASRICGSACSMCIRNRLSKPPIFVSSPTNRTTLPAASTIQPLLGAVTNQALQRCVDAAERQSSAAKDSNRSARVARTINSDPLSAATIVSQQREDPTPTALPSSALPTSAQPHVTPRHVPREGAPCQP